MDMDPGKSSARFGAASETTSWTGVRVLVTGARGFLGSNVARRLAYLGADVCGLARELPQSDDGTRWFAGDLTTPSSVEALLGEARPEVVFHLAGQTVAAPERDWVLPSFRNNLTSTVNLLTQIGDTSCRRLVVTGSLEEPAPHDLDAVPRSPYGASKWAEVVYSRMFHALYRLPVVIVRPYMTYGPRQRPSKLIPYVTLSLLRGDPPTIGQPDRRIDWIYVDDLVDGILAAACARGVEGATFDLGSGTLVSIREIAHQLRDLIGGNTALQMQTPERSVGVDGRMADLALTRKLLAWEVKTPLKEGLRQTVEWYRSWSASHGGER